MRSVTDKVGYSTPRHANGTFIHLWAVHQLSQSVSEHGGRHRRRHLSHTATLDLDTLAGLIGNWYLYEYDFA